MSDLLEEAKRRVGHGSRTPEAEWAALLSVLVHAGAQTDAILQWVFAEAVGYTDTRVHAGAAFLQRHPLEGWRILERLRRSPDPDDRDVALTLLSLSTDPRAPELAKPCLRDPYPYLQFAAVDFLAATYPTEVVATLRTLAQHERPAIRNAAQERLWRMGHER